ncbi:MAG TPA: DUF6206 family protein [Vicinamibacteria bacterium]
MIDPDLLRRFEESLEPRKLEASADLLGCGEISSVFAMGSAPGVAYKRLPLFASTSQARAYAESYRRYTTLLREAGLDLPEDDTCVLEVPGRPVVLYIAQRRLPGERFGHALIRRMDGVQSHALLDSIGERIERVWAFNERRRPEVELALDGQISNWALLAEGRLLFVDTSTPLFRVQGVEQLDPELFLASAPAVLRGLLRRAFLGEVMSRYYDRRRVLLDLVANLHKEGRADLVPVALESVNARLKGEPPLRAEEVRRYYAGDRTIWTVFQALRRLDRWLKTRAGRRYEFVLPGPIRR